MRRALSSVLGILLASGCNGEEEVPNPSCTEEKQPENLPTSLDVPQRGTVTIRDTFHHTKDPVSHQGVVVAKFADFTTVTSTPSDLSPLGEFCVGTVSRPQQSNPPERIAMDQLEVEGTKNGVMTLSQTVSGTITLLGTFSDVGSPLLLETGNVRVAATAPSGGVFPSFDQTIETVKTIDLLEPTSDGTSELKVDELKIAWTPGNGEFVMIRISPDDPQDTINSGGHVTCAVVDDGCFNFPAAGGAFLLASGATTYTLVLSRHRYRAYQPSLETFLDIEVFSEWRTTLVNGEVQ